MRVRLIQVNAADQAAEALQEQLGMRGKMALEPVIQSVREILDAVRAEGDAALCRFTARWDHVCLTPDQLRVTPDEIQAAYRAVTPAVVDALRRAADSIRAYHQTQLAHEARAFMTEGPGGGRVGMRVRPLRQVGLYVPGGTAPLPSSVLMNAIPARVAGVRRLLMCTPPGPDGSVAPVILVAADLAGVDAVYKAGGAQAIAAMALGTETIPRVDKICGPGNIYVNTAKRLVFGLCDIDLFAGPSEILILADETADPAFLAADMLSQAEHDRLASAVLLTPDAGLADRVIAELERQFEQAGRRDILEASLGDYAAVIRTADLDQAVEIANALAPEHLELCVAEARCAPLLDRIEHAGAVFVGHYSPEPLGDYLAGPNHVLPTSGTARFFSPLNTGDFLKKMSVIQYDEQALLAVSAPVMQLARAESLDCHARAIAVRLAAADSSDSPDCGRGTADEKGGVR